MIQNIQKQVYSSRSDVKRVRVILKNLIRELPKAIAVAKSLALRDIKSKYRGNFLGYLWIIIQPVVYSLIYMVVKSGMMGSGFNFDTNGINAGLFAFFGIAIYQVWIEGLNAQLDSMRKNRDILRGLKIPPETFFLIPFFVGIVDMFVRFILIIIASLIFRVTFSDHFYLFPAILFAVLFSSHAVGFFLLPLATIYQDVRSTVRSFSLGILLISPVLYPATTNKDSILYYINAFNPFAATLTTSRDILYGGNLILLYPAIYWSIFLVIGVIFTFLTIRIILPLLIERIGI